MIEAKARFMPEARFVELRRDREVPEYSAEELRRIYLRVTEGADDGLGCVKGMAFAFKFYAVVFVVAALAFLCSCAPRCPSGFFPEGGTCLSVTIRPM